MTTEEKLQQAAKTYSDYKWGYLNKLQSNYEESVEDWLEGAKSPESLEYHKEREKLYSEEEVRILCNKAFSDGQLYGVEKTLDPDYYMYINSPILTWFSQHKK